MVLYAAKSSSSNDVAHIRFPAEADKVKYDVLAVEELGGWLVEHGQAGVAFPEEVRPTWTTPESARPWR